MNEPDFVNSFVLRGVASSFQQFLVRENIPPNRDAILNCQLVCDLGIGWIFTVYGPIITLFTGLVYANRISSTEPRGGYFFTRH